MSELLPDFRSSSLHGSSSSAAAAAAASARDSSIPEPTIAAFSPNQQTATRAQSHATVLIRQNSALLVATPPQVTRALAYSHPFIVPLNYLVGLLSWTTGDPWESFLLVAVFWLTVLYGDDILRWAGPVVVVLGLIAGMYSRRYSPLSSATWNGQKQQQQQQRQRAATDSEQRKSLDEIIDTLHLFANRCDVLLDPLLRLTEFLSTQATATSATTRPALTSMFVRLLAITPVWIVLTLPPLRILTTRRILLVIGTVGLTWHSRPTRASRTILWRSRSVRYATSVITGLHFTRTSTSEKKTPPPLPRRAPAALLNALQQKENSAGVRFTFALYENQRQWVFLGFTNNLLPNERQAWTDEHQHPVASKEEFPLPETESDTTKWRWVPGSEWQIDPSWTDDISGKGVRNQEGWTYYDNKWQYGSRTDDWNKWTRRRRWIRDAELVEISPEDDTDAQSTTTSDLNDSASVTAVKKKGWFGKRHLVNEKSRFIDKAENVSMSDSGDTGGTKTSRDSPDDDLPTPLPYRETQWDRSIGDGLAEGLS